MNRTIWLSVLFILWLASGTFFAQSRKAPSSPSTTDHVPASSAETQRTVSSGDTAEPRYYDRRERRSAQLTFEWNVSSNRTYSRAYLQSHSSGSETSPLPEYVIELDGERLLLPQLQGSYVVARTPRLSRIQSNQEIPMITKNIVMKSDRRLRWDYFYLGETGEVVAAVFRGLDSEDVGSVDVAFAGKNGVGLPSPFTGPFTGDMIFLGGVSPFRLLGAEPADWKIAEVNEEQWVFELHPDESKTQSMTGLLRFDSVRIHLSRKHDDAPLRLEVRAGDNSERWETLAFKQVHGVWMPQVVMVDHRGAGSITQVQFDLVKASPTGTLTVDIPVRTIVRDWCEQRQGLWQNRRHSSGYLETEWSPELLSSLWRRVQASSSR